MTIHRETFHKLIFRVAILALALGTAAVLSGFGPDLQAVDPTLAEDQPRGKVLGRALVGAVGDDPETGQEAADAISAVATGAVGRLTIMTPQGEITVQIDENTSITSPSGTARVLERISQGLPVRVAILTDRPPLGDDGTPTGELATALKLAIIPGKAVREHRRVIVAEKRDSDNVTTVDSDGNTSELAVADPTGVQETGDILADEGRPADRVLSSIASDLPEQGEITVLLVRPGKDNEQKEVVAAVVRTRRVIERLSRLADEAKLRDEDVFKSARLENLLEQHRNSVKTRLENILEAAETRFKEVVDRAAERATKALEILREERGGVSGLNEEKTECIIRILGRLPASKSEIPPEQLRRIENQCLETDRDRPQVRLLSPSPGTTLTEGQEIELRISEWQYPGLTTELLINGEVHVFDDAAGDRLRIQVRVPVGEPILSVQIIQRLPDADETLLKLLFDVRRDPPPRLRITSESTRQDLVPGATLNLGVRAEDNGEVVSVRLVVNGQVLGTGGSSIRGVEFSVPTDASSLVIEATATDDSGNTSSVTRTLKIEPDPAPRVWIASPEAGERLVAGTTVTVSAQAQDNGQVVSIEFMADGGRLAPVSLERNEIDSVTASLPGFEGRIAGLVYIATLGIPVPTGVASLAVQAIATDDLGNTATANRTWDVETAEDTSPVIKILAPSDRSSVVEGSALTVQVEAEDDGRVTAVTVAWPRTGVTVPARFRDGLWTAETTVPTLSSPVTRTASSVPPHVFVGTVTIDGVTAADGTVVTAWLEGGASTEITLQVTATDDGGNQTVASLELGLLSQQNQIGEATVANGSYTLLVEQLAGQNLAGRTINFRVDGVAVEQTATWEQGGGDELPIRAISGR